VVHALPTNAIADQQRTDGKLNKVPSMTSTAHDMSATRDGLPLHSLLEHDDLLHSTRSTICYSLDALCARDGEHVVALGVHPGQRQLPS
jgi:hypothetical protein